MSKEILQLKQGLRILLIALALYAVDYSIKYNVRSLTDEDFASVSGTLNTLKQERYDRSFFYVFSLKEYPNILFRVDFSYGTLLTNRLETMPMGTLSPLNMRISREDYDLKIAKPPKRDTRIFNRNAPYLEVYELDNPSNNFVYLSLDEYKTHYASRLGIYTNFIGFGLLLAGGFELLRFGFLWLRQYFKIL